MEIHGLHLVDQQTTYFQRRKTDYGNVLLDYLITSPQRCSMR